MGDTFWAARLADGNLLGLAWEWVVVGAGLVVLRDPNGIISNAWLEDESGEQLPELRALCVVNGMAHATPWQQTVCRCLGVAQPPGRPQTPPVPDSDLVHGTKTPTRGVGKSPARADRQADTSMIRRSSHFPIGTVA